MGCLFVIILYIYMYIFIMLVFCAVVFFSYKSSYRVKLCIFDK